MLKQSKANRWICLGIRVGANSNFETNTNTNNIRFLKMKRIRIYSEFQTLFEYIRIVEIIRIRIRIVHIHKVIQQRHANLMNKL